MTRFVIFGDSWSLHSWSKHPDIESKKEIKGNTDFQTMFAQHQQTALNLSEPACSNQDILSKIRSTNLANQDQLIVFQTDPLRDFVKRRSFKMRYKPNQTFTNLIQAAEHQLSIFYQGLADLGAKILLIGGLARLAHDLVPDNIDTIEPSWTELIQPGFEDCYFEWIEFAELVNYMLQCTEDTTLVQQQIQAKNYVWQTTDGFAWCHPSDIGYAAMFDKIKTKLDFN
jgi:hypothetical protein